VSTDVSIQKHEYKLWFPSGWLVVEPYPSEKYESQLGLLFPTYGKKNIWVVVQ
jgi:hypothetical protein